MARFYKKHDHDPNYVPGQLVFVGEQKTDKSLVRLIEYDQAQIRDEQLDEARAAAAALTTDSVSWINVDGLHETQGIGELGKIFGLHPLLVGDILNTGQRPHLEEFPETLFLVLKMLRLEKDSDVVVSEQLSMVLGKSFLMTFQEQPGDVFEPVRARIREGRGRVRISGEDYLAYALLDMVIKNYVLIIEQFGTQIEELEIEALTSSDPGLLARITDFKREMAYLRKCVRPVRETISQLAKLDNALIRPETAPFLEDLLVNATQAAEAIETYREMLSDALNTYNSMISNRMNDIMKVLTIFAALFIPLTFVAGIYGTNFEYLPELKFRYSYHIFWGVLITMAAGMLIFFRRRGWL